ncbi:MAG TPA: carboxypeptidase-like regulatory domain-containing protein, partial [Myxococcaceae bacterium]
LKALTDARGHYRVGPVVAGAYSFDVSAPRYVDLENSDHDLTADTGPVDFTLQPAAVLAGVVVDEEGQPVPDVHMELVSPPEPEAESDAPLSMTWADGEGRFTIDAPRMGEWVLNVSDDRFLSREMRVQAPTENLRMVLSRGATVVSTLSDESGAPVEGAWVVLWVAEGKGQSERSERTDAQGRATLRGIKPGRYMLEAALDHQGVDRRVARSLEVRGSEQLQVPLRFDEGWTLSGTVVDGKGQPLEGIAIRAELPHEVTPTWRDKPLACGNRRTNDTYTGPDGRFTVKHLMGEAFEVYAWEEGFTLNLARSVGGKRERGTLLVREGAGELRLVMERHARIHGRVVGPDGSPLRRFSVNAQTVSDAGGAFEVPFEETMEARLEFTAPGMAPTLRKVQAREGIDVDLGEVRLDEGRRVTGRVVDAETGAPVARARVRTSDPGDNDAGFIYSEELLTRTQEDGSFELAHVEVRALTLEIEHEGYLKAHRPLGTGTETVSVSLDPGARVEVTLRDARGVPLEGEIELLQEGHDRRETIRVRQGRGLRRGLAPGSYLARASVFDETGEGSLLSQRVSIPERGPVVLSFTQRLEGVTLKVRREGPGPGDQLDPLVLPGNGLSPLTGSDLKWWRFAGVQPEQLDQTGAWIFRHLPPGKARVLLISYADKRLYHLEELELPESGVVERVIQPTWRELPE